MRQHPTRPSKLLINGDIKESKNDSKEGKTTTAEVSRKNDSNNKQTIKGLFK